MERVAVGDLHACGVFQPFLRPHPHFRAAVGRAARRLAALVERRRLERRRAEIDRGNDAAVGLAPFAQPVVHAGSHPADIDEHPRRLFRVDGALEPARRRHGVEAHFRLDLDEPPAAAERHGVAVLAHPGRIEADDERPRRRGFSLARPRDQRRRNEAVVAGELKRFGRVARILLLEQSLVLEFGDLLPPPRQLRVGEAVQLAVLAFLGGQRRDARGRILSIAS
jgi:hypothetical protein